MGTQAYQQATPSIRDFTQSMSAFGLNADQAASQQKMVNGIISDGNVSLSEAASLLGNYNQVTGQSVQYSQQQIGQSQDMLAAIMQISDAQNLYTKYMSDGSLSAQESADINSRMSEVYRLLGDAGVNAQNGVSNLPGALQSLCILMPRMQSQRSKLQYQMLMQPSLLQTPMSLMSTIR